MLPRSCVLLVGARRPHRSFVLATPDAWTVLEGKVREHDQRMLRAARDAPDTAAAVRKLGDLCVRDSERQEWDTLYQNAASFEDMEALTAGGAESIRRERDIPTMARLISAVLACGFVARRGESGSATVKSLSRAQRLEFGEWLLEHGVTPLVVLVRTMGVREDMFKVEALGSRGDRDTFIVAPVDFFHSVMTFTSSFCACDACFELRWLMGSLRRKSSSYQWAAFEEYEPRRLSRGPPIFLDREAATAVFQRTLKHVVEAKRASTPISRANLPIMVAGGAPGVGKSHFLDQVGRVAREALAGTHTVVHINLSLAGETRGTGPEHIMLTDSILAARLLRAVYATHVTLNEFERRHPGHFLCMSATQALDYIAADAARVAATASTGGDEGDAAAETAAAHEPATPLPVAFVICIDEFQAALCDVGELCHALGDAMLRSDFPVVWVLAGHSRGAMEAAVREAAHPCRTLPLDWLNAQSQTQFVAQAAECGPWWFSCDHKCFATTGTATELKLLPAQHARVPFVQQLVADTSGHPRTLAVLVEVLAGHLKTHPLFSDVAAADVGNVDQALRAAFLEQFSRISSGYAWGLGLPDPQLATIIACAVGHLPVRQDTELVVGFTVEQLQEKGVLSYQDHACCEGYQSIKVTFLMMKRWVRSLSVRSKDRYWCIGRDNAARLATREADAARAHATRALLWSLRRWFQLEHHALVSAASQPALSTVVGEGLACVRANAIGVAAFRAGLGVAVGQRRQGAQVGASQREAGAEVSVKLCRFARACQKLGWSDGDAGARVPCQVDVRACDGASHQVVINGDTGTAPSALVAHQRAEPGSTAPLSSLLGPIRRKALATSCALNLVVVRSEFSPVSAQRRTTRGKENVTATPPRAHKDGMNHKTSPTGLREARVACTQQLDAEPMLQRHAPHTDLANDKLHGPMFCARPVMRLVFSLHSKAPSGGSEGRASNAARL